MALRQASLVTTLPAPRRRPGEQQVFVPALDRFPSPLRDLMGVLPVCAINTTLLETLAMGPVPRHLVAGLFAVDPFLDRAAVLKALRQAGLSALANYPTVQLIDGAAGEGLAAVGYHARAEFAVLTDCVADGFAAFAYVASVQAAEEALALGLDRLVIHEGLRPGLPRPAQARITAMAEEAGAALFMHRA